jgi:acyl carrier protein
MPEERPPTTIQDDELLDVLTSVYRTVKRNKRDLTLSDRLVDDLDLDSLDMIDIIAMLEDELDRGFLDEVSRQLDQTVTVGDFVDVLRRTL